MAAAPGDITEDLQRQFCIASQWRATISLQHQATTLGISVTLGANVYGDGG